MNIVPSQNLASLCADFSKYHGAEIQLQRRSPQPADASPEAAPTQSAPDIPPDNPRSLHSELDDLLRSISRETYRTVAPGDILNLIGDIKTDAAVRNDMIVALNDIQKTAKSAQKALSDAAGIKAAKLLKDVRSATAKNPNRAEAIDPEKIGSLKALVKAAEAQSEMSDKLLKLFNGDAEGLPEGFREKLADLAETCDRRASELSTLAMQMTALADEINDIAAQEKQHEVDKGTKNAVKAAFAGVLGRTVGDLAKDMGGAMHGNRELIIGAGSDAAFESIDKIQSAPDSAKVEHETLQRLETALKNLSAKLGPGQDPGNALAQRMDKRVHERFTHEIDAMAKRLGARERTIAMSMRTGIAAEYRCSIACELYADYKDDKLSKKFAHLFEGLKLRYEFEEALRTYAETGTTEALDALNEKKEALGKYSGKINKTETKHQLAKELFDFVCEAGSKSKTNIRMLRKSLYEYSINSTTLDIYATLNDDILKIDDQVRALNTKIKATIDKMNEMMKSVSSNSNEDRLTKLNEEQKKQFKACEKQLSDLNNKKNKLDQKRNDLDRERSNVVEPIKSILVNQLGFSKDYLSVTKARIDAFPLPGADGQSQLPAFRSGDVINVLRGNGRISDLFKFDINGIDPEIDADPTLNDDLIVSKEVLGSGAVNTVSLLQYQDGRKIVFKPEYSGAISLQALTVSGDGYDESQQAAKLNLAASHSARLLGCENRIVNSRVMYHDGAYGIGMDFAEGVPAANLDRNFIDGKSAKDICDKLKRKLEKNPQSSMRNDIGRVVNDTFEQTTDLQWCDLLSGQGDRHTNNYFVHIAPGTQEVSVAGIDNDMCFPSYRTGLTKIKVSGTYLDTLKTTLKSFLNKNEDLQKALQNFPIQFDEDEEENYIEIDFADNRISSEVLAALAKTFGIKSLSLPPFMSVNMYNHLMILHDNPEKMKEAIAEFRKYMSEENAAMAELRLKEMIQLAIKYKANGQIIESRDPGDPSSRPWLDAKVLEKLRPIDIKNLDKLSDADKPFIRINNAASPNTNADKLACRRRAPLVTRDFQSLLEIADVINDDNSTANPSK